GGRRARAAPRAVHRGVRPRAGGEQRLRRAGRPRAHQGRVRRHRRGEHHARRAREGGAPMSITTGLALLMWGGLLLTTGIQLARCIRMVPNRREYVVERLGKYSRTLGPGLHILVPFLDKVSYIRDLREESIEVEPQECFTADNVR